MSTKLLCISAELSAPPSSPSCFRDLSLQGSLRGYDIIAVSPVTFIDSYNRWFKNYGLWDYLDDLLPEGQIESHQITVEISGGENARLTANNIHLVLGYL